MYVFGNDAKSRGCFHVHNINEKIKQGATLHLPDGGKFPEGLAADPYFVTGVEFAHKEKYHLVECFGDKVHTYAFGFDPRSSLISVHFAAFMIAKSGEETSNAFERMLTVYGDNRLVNSQELVSVVLGGTGILQGFMVGMSSSTREPQHNLQNFTMMLLAVEAQTGGFKIE